VQLLQGGHLGFPGFIGAARRAAIALGWPRATPGSSPSPGHSGCQTVSRCFETTRSNPIFSAAAEELHAIGEHLGQSQLTAVRAMHKARE
jgi:hypothetical protein